MHEKIQAARTRLVFDRPYFAAAVWAMQVIEKPRLGSMGVDARWRMYYDPQVIEQWSLEEVTGVIIHEVNHLLREHSERCDDMKAQKQLWNIAADYAINSNLIEEKIVLPDNPCLPKDRGLKDGLTVEEYYNALLSEAGQHTTNVSELSEDSPSVGKGNCGSCAHGQRESWEEPLDGSSPNTPVPGISSAEATLVRRQVAVDLQQHIKMCGDVPGHLARWAEAFLSPKVDWRKVLASVVRSSLAHVSGATDYSYAKPARRQGQIGNGNIVLPSLRSPIPNVVVVIDTSGSMGEKELVQALAEVKGVLRSAGMHGVTVLSVDATVNTCKKVFDTKQVKLVGGGGTDMCVGIEHALNLKPKPHVIIVISDYYTPWPKEAPRGNTKIIGVAVGADSRSVAIAPKWLRTIVVD